MKINVNEVLMSEFSLKVDPFDQDTIPEKKSKVTEEDDTTIDCIDLNDTDYESVTTYRSISPTISLKTAASEFPDPDSTGRSKANQR